MNLNGLSVKTGAELALAFSGIPAHITYLALGFNGLGEKTGAELALAFSGIPAHVTALDLTGNNLPRLSVDELRLLRNALPRVRSIRLSQEELEAMSKEQLNALNPFLPGKAPVFPAKDHGEVKNRLALDCSGIPASVTALDLKGAGMNVKTGAELALAFSGIPAHVTALDLGCNRLGEKTGAELALAFSGIPDHVTTLDLRGNNLHRLSVDELKLLRNTLPGVHTIYLSQEELQAMSKEQRKALLLALPAALKTLFPDKEPREAKNQADLKKHSIHALLDSYLAKRTAVTDSSGVTKQYLHARFFPQKSFREKKRQLKP